MAMVDSVSSAQVPPTWQLLFGIIDRPTATFKAVLARRKWWMWAAPLLVVLVCMSAMMVVRAPYDAEITNQQMERQLATMPPDQAEAARASMETFTSLPFRLATSLITAVLVLLIGLVGQSAILYFSSLIAGGEVDFGSVFTMSAWTRLPIAVSFLVQAGFMLAAKRAIQAPGLSTLVATGDLIKDARNPLFTLLSRIEPFWLWHLLLTVLGLAVVARFSRRKALAVTIIYVVISLAVNVLPSMLFGSALGG
jgi:cell division protein FtsL